MNQELAANLIAINKKARPRNKHHHAEFSAECMRELAKHPGVFLKDQHKSRLTISRGSYYNYETALAIITLLENSRNKLPFVTTNENSSSPQWWRQGLAFVKENLDASGKYAELGKYIMPKFEAGRLKLFPRRSQQSVAGVMQNNVEFSTIVKWLDDANTGDTFMVNSLTDEDAEAIAQLASYDGEKLTRL